MKKLYENIKKQRLLHHMSQSDLAKQMGYADKSMISKIEKGTVDLPNSKISEFAWVFKIGVDELMGTNENTDAFLESDIDDLNGFLENFDIAVKGVNEEDPNWGTFYKGEYVHIDVEDLWDLFQNAENLDNESIDAEIRRLIRKSPKKGVVRSYFEYPYIPDAVAAGVPETIEGIAHLPRVAIADDLMGRYARRKNIIIMRVNGESMNRVIQNGAIIAVNINADVRNLKNGDIVVFNHDYNYSLKRFYKTPERLIFKPDSDDISFTDITYSTDENVIIVGKVVMSINKYE